MRKIFRADPIGDHCFFNDSGFGIIILTGIMIALFCSTAGILFSPILFICSAMCVLAVLIMYLYSRNKFGVEVHVVISGLIVKKGDTTIATASWTQIHEIGYQSWETGNNKKTGIAYAALQPLSNEQRRTIKSSSGSMNFPSRKIRDCSLP